MHFVKFHPKVTSCFLSRGKRKYAPLGMRLLWKYMRNYFLVYHLVLHFLLYLQNYKEFEAAILDLQLQKYGLSFDIKKYTTPGWALGDENGIVILVLKVSILEKKTTYRNECTHKSCKHYYYFSCHRLLFINQSIICGSPSLPWKQFTNVEFEMFW